MYNVVAQMADHKSIHTAHTTTTHRRGSAARTVQEPHTWLQARRCGPLSCEEMKHFSRQAGLGGLDHLNGASEIALRRFILALL